MQHKLLVVPRGAGSVEWRVEAPALVVQTAFRDVLLGLLLVAAPAAGLGAVWWRALLAAAGAAAVLLAARLLFSVQAETLTYVRLLGVQLASRRRCGLRGSTQFLPLRQLLGVIIHEEVTTTQVRWWLGLTLKPAAADSQDKAGSSRTSGGGTAAPGRPRRISSGSGGRRLVAEGTEVEVVFPRLRPRLHLLRQVYQQLQPLLQTDLDAMLEQPGAESSGGVPQGVRGAGGGAAAL